MPFVFLVGGLLMIVSALRNTQCSLGAQIQSDFTGNPNFFYWIAAIFCIGALGYIDAMKEVSRYSLVLIIVVLFLHNSGFFAKFIEQLQQGSNNPPPPPCPTPNSIAGNAAGAAIGGNPAGPLGGAFANPTSGGGGVGNVIGTAASIAGALL